MINKKRIKFWKDKKVLITGHTGFKGAWLAFVLKLFGAKVYGYSLKPDNKFNLYNLLDLKKNLNGSYINNILDYKKLNKILQKIKPDIVFHLAAQSLVGKSYKHPIETYKTNIIGSLNVMNTCRNITTVKSIMMITTDKVYKNSENIKKHKEEDKLGGEDPYSGSKSAAEMVIESFKKSFFNQNNRPKIGVLRAGNVIGGGDWNEDRIIPDIIKSIKNNKKLLIRKPYATRPWQHVLDTVWAYMIISQELFIKNSAAQDSWNIGPNNNKYIKVIDIVKIFQKNFKKLTFKIDKKFKYNESSDLKLNNLKMKKVFNWKPVLSEKENFKLTIDWYKEFLNKGDVKLITRRQVNYFFSKIIK